MGKLLDLILFFWFAIYGITVLVSQNPVSPTLTALLMFAIASRSFLNLLEGNSK